MSDLFKRVLSNALLPVALSVSLVSGCASEDGDAEAPGPSATGSGTLAPVDTSSGVPMSSPTNSMSPTPVSTNAGAGGNPGADSQGGAPAGGSSNPGMGGAFSGGGGDASGAGGTTPGGVGGSAMGGTSAGGSSMGGASTGGSGMGGTSAGGSAMGGASSGGSGGSESAAGTGSPGCGSATPLQSGTRMVDIEGTSRTYILDVPSNYDASNEYRLVFVWHPLGGNANQVANGYNGLKALSDNTTIFVAPDGQDGGNEMVTGRGWWNTNGGDMKFLDAMFAEVNENLCVDQERIFSTGFSFGGMMSYTVGSEYDVFRAIAPCSGNLTVIPHEETNTSPLAIMAFHGDNDTFVTTQGGRDARDQYLMRNHCSGETQPVDPSPCVEYQGCDQPTIWCEFPGAHETWSQQPQAIWNFFSQF